MGYKKAIQLLYIVIDEYQLDKELKNEIKKEIDKYESKFNVEIIE